MKWKLLGMRLKRWGWGTTALFSDFDGTLLMSRLTPIYAIYGLLSTTSGLGVRHTGPAGRTVGSTGGGNEEPSGLSPPVIGGGCHVDLWRIPLSRSMICYLILEKSYPKINRLEPLALRPSSSLSNPSSCGGNTALENDSCRPLLEE
jgi:hypothetical protein